MSGMERPIVTVLWEGIPLQELGIADALCAVTFTETVGRTKPTKKFVGGKPKVGSASLKFKLTDRNVAQAILRLLHRHERPTLSVSFGYEDGESFWVGSFGPGAPANIRDFKRIGAFKVDKPKWEYDSSSVSAVTLSGVTDKAVGMAEQMRPRVYDETTMRKILEGVANEFGVTLEVDEGLDLGTPLKHVVKTSHESTLEWLYRMGEMLGVANIEFEQAFSNSNFQTGSVGARGQNGYDVVAQSAASPFDAQSLQAIANKSRRDSGVFYPPEGVDATAFTPDTTTSRDARNAIRTILRVRKIPGYLNLNQLEQAKPLILAYGSFLSTADKERVHRNGFFVKSVSIDEEGYRGGGVAVPAGVKGNNSSEALAVGENLAGGIINQVPVGAPILGNASAQQGATRRSRKSSIPNQNGYLRIVSALPDEMAAGARFSSAQMFAVAIYAGFAFTVNVDCFPGIPYLIPNMQAELLGTDGHDGLYGVEESTFAWDESSFGTRHVLKPLNVADRGAGKKRAPVGAGPDALEVGENLVGGIINQYTPGAPILGTKEPRTVTRAASPVTQAYDDPVADGPGGFE